MDWWALTPKGQDGPPKRQAAPRDLVILKGFNFPVWGWTLGADCMVVCYTNANAVHGSRKDCRAELSGYPHDEAQLEVAAAQERRSLTNMFEVLVDDYCRMHGISEDEVGSQKRLSPRGGRGHERNNKNIGDRRLQAFTEHHRRTADGTLFLIG